MGQFKLGRAVDVLKDSSILAHDKQQEKQGLTTELLQAVHLFPLLAKMCGSQRMQRTWFGLGCWKVEETMEDLEGADGIKIYSEQKPDCHLIYPEDCSLSF